MSITNQIECPKCHELISIDAVLSHQIEEKIKRDYETRQKAKEEEFERKTEALKKEAEAVAKSKSELDAIIAQKVSDKVTVEKLELFKKAKIEAEKEQASKTALLEEQLKMKNEKLEQANKNEAVLLKEKMRLQEEKQAFEVEKLRQLEEAKKTITEEASKKAEEAKQYEIAQLKKQLSDATKAKDELARKLEQGSQQTQGEVLELELEEILKTEFPEDEIVPVPKGMNGADIVQKVVDRAGRACGQIVWESKKTKAWSEGWIQKLKDDQRTIKAEIAVVVSATLPEEVKGFMARDGVWICDVKMALALATALRMNLIALAHEKAMSVGKNEKMEVLYAYLTGVEFSQRVLAIAEAFSSMHESLKKERMAFEKLWSEREKQLQKVMKNTVGMYGEIGGIVALPQIKMLELEGGEK